MCKRALDILALQRNALLVGCMMDCRQQWHAIYTFLYLSARGDSYVLQLEMQWGVVLSQCCVHRLSFHPVLCLNLHGI